MTDPTLPGGRALQHVADTVIRITRVPRQPTYVLHYVRKNRSTIIAKKGMNQRLQLCRSDAFNVVIATDRGHWVVMGTGWSLGAEPGNWVRRSRGFQFGADETDELGEDDVDRRPEGMVISSTHDFETDRMQFLILWFR